MHLEPKNTFAIVVGIERYTAGEGWDLKGPISDGSKFVRWLRSQDVPPENILLFATPLPKQGNMVEGVRMIEAQTERIRKSLLKPGFNGQASESNQNLLYIFWSGHGVINADQDQCLVCSDVESDDPRVFNLKDIRKQLRTRKWAVFQRQVFIIDACATYYRELGFKNPLSEIDIRSADTEIDGNRMPPQFIIHAASPGQAANNDDIEETGRFFNLFYKALDIAPRDGLLYEMQQLWENILSGYEKLKADAKLVPEIPRILVIDWNDSIIPHGLPMQEGESMREAKLKFKVYEKLRELNVDLNLLRGCYLAMGGRPEKAETINSMVDDLSELLSLRLPPLLQFIARVAFGINQPELENWLEQLIKSEGLELPALIAFRKYLEEEGQPFRPPYYLFINIPSFTPFRLTYWVFDQAGKLAYKPEAKDEPEVRPTPEAIEQAIEVILKNPALASFTTDLSIELFVPDDLLRIEADQWRDPHDGDRLLGANYRVALRWRERADRTAVVAADRWKKIATIIRESSCKQLRICWTEQRESSRRFSFDELKEQVQQHACIGFPFNPFTTSTGKPDVLLEKALLQGIPFALWLRVVPDDWETLRRTFDTEVEGDDLEQTPERLRRLRRNNAVLPTDPGRCLSILWDDPLRNPFEYDPKLNRSFVGAHNQLIDI